MSSKPWKPARPKRSLYSQTNIKMLTKILGRIEILSVDLDRPYKHILRKSISALRVLTAESYQCQIRLPPVKHSQISKKQHRPQASTFH